MARSTTTSAASNRRAWLGAALAVSASLSGLARAQQAPAVSKTAADAGSAKAQLQAFVNAAPLPVAKRLITLSGALTELVYQLGAEQLLVGSDTTSNYPGAANKTPKVGYVRQLAAEGVLSLKPDTVIGTTEAGPPIVLSQIHQAGVAVALVQSDHTFDEVLRKLREEFRSCNAYARPECADCWAKLYCSGGCAANAFHASGTIRGVYAPGCELFKKRIECAFFSAVLNISIIRTL